MSGPGAKMEGGGDKSATSGVGWSGHPKGPKDPIIRYLGLG